MPGKAGRCGVRFNRNGKPDIPFYGYVTSLAIDPIEKKPLYHYRPGTKILSAGFSGCNMACPFCQNWRISQTPGAEGRFFSPAELIRAARFRAEAGTRPAIAYTYSEPLVHAEFLLDCMKEARGAGIANVLVTNGCVNPEAAGEILGLCDAANIDLKCFSAKSYREILGGDFSATLDFIRAAAERGVHLELTTLVVPGLNDSREELDKCRDFIAELPAERGAVPWHLSAYRPEWKWRAPATGSASLTAEVKRAREKLKFVYGGNIPSEGNFNDTLCPRCGKVLVGRRFYTADTSNLRLGIEGGKSSYFCASCGEKAPLTL